MDDGLRVEQDRYFVGRGAEQPVGFDDLEPFALVGADAQIVVFVHREVHGAQPAVAAQRFVEADGFGAQPFAPLVFH